MKKAADNELVFQDMQNLEADHKKCTSLSIIIKFKCIMLICMKNKNISESEKNNEMK